MGAVRFCWFRPLRLFEDSNKLVAMRKIEDSLDSTSACGAASGSGRPRETAKERNEEDRHETEKKGNRKSEDKGRRERVGEGKKTKTKKRFIVVDER